MSNTTQCLGHQLRNEIQDKIAKLSNRNAVPIDSSHQLNVKTGPQQEQWSLADLKEKEQQSSEWKEMVSGKLRAIPVLELRLNKLPFPDASGNVDIHSHVQGRKANEIDSYGVDESEENMERKFKDMYDQLKANDTPEREIRATILKSKQNTALQSWKDTKGEISTRNAICELFSTLSIPGLLVRSVEKEKAANQDVHPKLKNLDALHTLGLNKIPRKASEIDLLLAYVSGNFLHIVLCEVKRPTVYPWDPIGKTPSKDNINKALHQLLGDCDLVSAFLDDIPGSRIIIHAVSSFPGTPVGELESLFCHDCMEKVLGYEDLNDPKLLKKKLRIPESPTTAMPASLEDLLDLTTRMVGQHSLLHLGWRRIKDISRLETARMETNIACIDRKVSEGQYVILSDQQQNIISQMSTLFEPRHLTVCGRAGSGKTVTLLACIKYFVRLFTDDKVVLVVSGYRQSDTDPIQQHLEGQTKDQGDVRFAMGWEGILKKFNLDGKSFKAGRNDAYGNSVKHTPAIIKALSENVSAEHPGSQVIIAIDELDANYAPVTQNGEQYDWTILSQVPNSVRLVLVFNPGSVRKPLLLPSGPAFLHMESHLRYRATRNITALVNCIGEITGQGLTVPDDSATDLDGQLPILADIGQLADISVLKNILEKLAKKLSYEDRDRVTVLVDRFISPSAKKMVTNFGESNGWEVCSSSDFTGWEDETIIFVGPGGLEPLSRARLVLCIVLFWENQNNPDNRAKTKYERYHPGFLQAVENGLVCGFES